MYKSETYACCVKIVVGVRRSRGKTCQYVCHDVEDEILFPASTRHVTRPPSVGSAITSARRAVQKFFPVEHGPGPSASPKRRKRLCSSKYVLFTHSRKCLYDPNAYIKLTTASRFYRNVSVLFAHVTVYYVITISPSTTINGRISIKCHKINIM